MVKSVGAHSETKKGRPEETGSARVSAGSWVSRSQFLSGSLAFGPQSPCIMQNNATLWLVRLRLYPGTANMSNPILVEFFVVAFDGRWDSSVFRRQLIREPVRLMHYPRSPWCSPKPLNALPMALTKALECAPYSMALTKALECAPYSMALTKALECAPYSMALTKHRNAKYIRWAKSHSALPTPWRLPKPLQPSGPRQPKHTGQRAAGVSRHGA